MKRKFEDNIEIITLDGRVDQEVSEELEGVLKDCLAKKRMNICIDMMNVKHCLQFGPWRSRGREAHDKGP